MFNRVIFIIIISMKKRNAAIINNRPRWVTLLLFLIMLCFFLLFTPLLLPFICIYDVIENILRAQGITTVHTYIMYDIIFNNNPACVGENFVSRATWKPSNAAAYIGKPPPFSTLDFICTLHWFTPLNCACVKSHVWPPLYFVLQIGAAHEYCIKLYGKRIPNATGMSCCSLHSARRFIIEYMLVCVSHE